jgi:hypothetical protein
MVYATSHRREVRSTAVIRVPLEIFEIFDIFDIFDGLTRAGHGARRVFATCAAPAR